MPDYPLMEILNRLSRKDNWIDGVTITGGEPTMREELPRLLRLVRATGVGIKLDTNGSRPDVLQRLVNRGLVDAVFMDIKAPLNQEAYSKVAGTRVNIAAIRQSIEILKKSNLEVVFRTTAIPGLVQEQEIEEILHTLGDVQRFIVQPFRNKETLDPQFSSIPEFDRGRFDGMRDRFEIVPGSSYEARRIARAG